MRALLYYVRRYVREDDARRLRLYAAWRKAHGGTLDRSVISRHLNLRVAPYATPFLFYLNFLHGEKAIRPARPGEKSLFVWFVCTQPELLRAKP